MENLNCWWPTQLIWFNVRFVLSLLMHHVLWSVEHFMAQKLLRSLLKAVFTYWNKFWRFAWINPITLIVRSKLSLAWKVLKICFLKSVDWFEINLDFKLMYTIFIFFSWVKNLERLLIKLVFTGWKKQISEVDHLRNRFIT